MHAFLKGLAKGVAAVAPLLKSAHDRGFVDGANAAAPVRDEALMAERQANAAIVWGLDQDNRRLRALHGAQQGVLQQQAALLDMLL